MAKIVVRLRAAGETVLDEEFGRRRTRPCRFKDDILRITDAVGRVLRGGSFHDTYVSTVHRSARCHPVDPWCTNAAMVLC
jgi:hypothetical protein